MIFFLSLSFKLYFNECFLFSFKQETPFFCFIFSIREGTVSILYNSKIVDNITKIQIDKNMNIVVSMINSRCFNIKTNYNQKEYNNKFCLDGNLTLFSTPRGSKSTYIYNIDISKPSNESSIQGKND